ncbi:MAG: SNF2-related protein [Acidimicrobiales bacterium]
MHVHGTLRYDEGGGRQGSWVIAAEPHVMTRIKRIFPRVQRFRTGEIALADTPEVARDLTWVLGRFTFELDDDSRVRLEHQTARQLATEETVQRILAGAYQPPLLREPARAARPYQSAAAEIVLATGRLLLLDELGLGKSMSAILALRDPRALPALVVTLTHLPTQWLGELEKTLPWLRGHVLSSGRPYDVAERCGGAMPDVIVSNYHKLAGWSDELAGVVRTVIFDEVQELRRNDSQKYVAAAQIADAAAFRCGLSATPVYNRGGEAFNIVSVLDRDALGSKSEFDTEWGDANGGVRDPAALGSYLRDAGLMLRRTRKEVGRELLDVVRLTEAVSTDDSVLDQLTGDAIEMAKLLVTRAASPQELFKMSGELDWRLRHATGVAKAPYVAEFVRLLMESEEQIVLFGWHRDVYDIWLERLLEFRPVLYTGSESPRQKQENEQAFLDGKSRILVMSLRAGAGLDGLQERAHVCVFGELDWSPGVHAQCIGRLHRDGQSEPVVALFMVADEGADPVMVEINGVKLQQSEPMLDPAASVFLESELARDRIRLLAHDLLTRRGIEVGELLADRAS